MAVTYRLTKGEELTHPEMDENFKHLDVKHTITNTSPTDQDNLSRGFKEGVLWTNTSSATTYYCLMCYANYAYWEPMVAKKTYEVAKVESILDGNLAFPSDWITVAVFRLLGSANIGENKSFTMAGLEQYYNHYVKDSQWQENIFYSYETYIYRFYPEASFYSNNSFSYEVYVDYKVINNSSVSSDFEFSITTTMGGVTPNVKTDGSTKGSRETFVRQKLMFDVLNRIAFIHQVLFEAPDATDISLSAIGLSVYRVNKKMVQFTAEQREANAVGSIGRLANESYMSTYDSSISSSVLNGNMNISNLYMSGSMFSGEIRSITNETLRTKTTFSLNGSVCQSDVNFIDKKSKFETEQIAYNTAKDNGTPLPLRYEGYTILKSLILNGIEMRITDFSGIVNPQPRYHGYGQIVNEYSVGNNYSVEENFCTNEEYPYSFTSVGDVAKTGTKVHHYNSFGIGTDSINYITATFLCTNLTTREAWIFNYSCIITVAPDKTVSKRLEVFDTVVKDVAGWTFAITFSDETVLDYARFSIVILGEAGTDEVLSTSNIRNVSQSLSDSNGLDSSSSSSSS